MFIPCLFGDIKIKQKNKICKTEFVSKERLFEKKAAESLLYTVII